MSDPETNDEEQQVRSSALAGATDQEIADLLGWDVDELQFLCGPLLRKTRATRRISLRQKQTTAAVEGNITMLTFLGKHELGQGEQDSSDDDDWPQPQLDPKVG
jgi:hypothetical protein